jgi:prolipoprotein diacylglyceryltransferase
MRFIYNRYDARTPNGLLLGVFFICIFGARFLVEFSKENQVAFENGLPLNMGQILSIPLVLLGAFLVWRALAKPVITLPNSTISNQKAAKKVKA